MAYVNKSEGDSMTAFNNDCIQTPIEHEQPEPVERMLEQVYKVTEDIQPVAFYDVGIACGEPFDPMAEQNLEDIDMNEFFCPRQNTCFIARARGESMIEAGINDGDMISFDSSVTEIIPHKPMLCEVDGEYTIKYVEKKNGCYYLVPANPMVEVRKIGPNSNFHIRGVVIGVAHKF